MRILRLIISLLVIGQACAADIAIGSIPTTNAFSASDHVLGYVNGHARLVERAAFPWEIASAALSALTADPNLYQATNSILTTLGGIGAGAAGQVVWHDGTRWTNSSANAFQATNSAITILAGNDGSYLTNANPSGATNQEQFITLKQLEESVRGGITKYFDTAVPANGFTLTGTVKATNYMSSVVLPTQWTNSAVTTANGEYLIAFMSTNTYSTVAGGLGVVEVFAFESSAGSGAVTAEIYVVNSVTKAEEAEFEPAPAYQTVAASSTPTKLTFSIPMTNYTSTTNFHLIVKLKVQESSTDPTIRIVTGGVYPSHLTFSVPSTAFVMKAGDTMTGTLVAPAYSLTGQPAWYQPTNAALTALAANANLYQSTNAVLTTVAGIGAGTGGDILYRDANRWTNLAKSTDGTSLKLVGGYPAWTAKKTKELKFRGWDAVYSLAMIANTNDVSATTFMRPNFIDDAVTNVNYMTWFTSVPADIDTGVALTARLYFKLTGADTGSQNYDIGFADVAASAAVAATAGTWINLSFAGDASGASGDLEYVDSTTLTGWAAGLTAKHGWLIQLSRDGAGSNAADTSTVDSQFWELVITYTSTE